MVSFLSWVVQAIIMTGIGAIGYFLKQTSQKTDARITQNEKKLEQNGTKLELVEDKLMNKIENVSRELSDHKEMVQKEFITKGDYAQSYGEINKKLDKIQDYLMQIVKEGR